jgi:O-acetyl-ADP-ribose deacetylase (regulator of RNase III)
MSNVSVLVGDLFESSAQTLTNTVNTVGVMGKGIALGFKKRFPVMYEDYVQRCERGDVRLGEPYLFRPLIPPWILNFPTKDHWRSAAKLTDIQAGLDYLVDHHEAWGIESLAVPPLGCGEGQLEWRVVGPTLYRGLARLSIPVELYAPFGTPHHELTPDFLEALADAEAPESRVPAAAVAIAAIVDRIVSQRHHYPVGRTVFQKIAYFATQAGLPTGLEYERRPYGPFADGAKRLSAKLVNNGLLAEERRGDERLSATHVRNGLVQERRGDAFDVQPGPTLADGERAFAAELTEWGPTMDRVADLFLRLPRTRDAELAASAHYVADQLAARHRAKGQPPPSEEEIVEQVARWKVGRKPRPSTEDILRAVRTLDHLGWIDAPPSHDDELLGV